MNRRFHLKASLAIAALLVVVPVAQAATFTKGEYDAGKTGISADYKANQAARTALAGNAKAGCIAAAKAAFGKS